MDQNLSLFNRRFPWLTVAVVIGSACASGGGPAGDTAGAPAERIGPLEGTNYLLYYGDHTGIRVRNTIAPFDSLLVGGAVVEQVEVAPGGAHAAVVFRHGDSVVTGVVRASRPGMVVAHVGTAAGEWTLGWSSDGRLGIGYRGGPGESSAVIGVSGDNQIWNMGCSASNRFYAWAGSGRAVVGDGRNVYTVGSRGCGTLSTLPMQGKTDFRFSADGRRLSFVRGGNQAGMYIANVNGSGATRVADAMFNPRNARWAPDAGRVAFEIRSRQYANVTHLAVHHVATGQIRFSDQETELGMPIDGNACWAPDGRSLLHERTYYRAGAAADYVTRQMVRKTVADNRERIVSEALISLGRGPEMFACWWIGGDRVVVLGADAYELTHLTTTDRFEVPAARRLLLIAPI